MLPALSILITACCVTHLCYTNSTEQAKEHYNSAASRPTRRATFRSYSAK